MDGVQAAKLHNMHTHNMLASFFPHQHVDQMLNSPVNTV